MPVREYDVLYFLYGNVEALGVTLPSGGFEVGVKEDGVVAVVFCCCLSIISRAFISYDSLRRRKWVDEPP